ncbi:type ISP restriction/modification enzyme [Pleurocapsa sp. FMAR1]|uniref:type ISP restriction/modification enzyme n=1 Tax=Pleurocapsa sp. FMAR1 TaxID=3040204 RepID=UPI0039B0E7EF
MSKFLVAQYHQEVEKLIQYGGTIKETAIRSAFQNLLNEYCKPKDYLLIPELDYKTKAGKTVRPDGTVKDAIRLDYGYWEAKDKYDNLDEEIEKKFAKGYPDRNILFEDSLTAVLIQHGDETGRIDMKDTTGLDGLISEFVNYVPPEVTNFRQAIKSFREDIPKILIELRDLIEKQTETNKQFSDSKDKFLAICRQSINPEVSFLDVREMIIQHILTEDIFISIFNETQFHRENNIARELHLVVNTFFTGNIKRNTFSKINSYYEVIKRTAANIANHHEKQKFLKAIYENFYQAYNPKAADRLGIVYTPNEIVRFMVQSVDYLTHKHFGKLLEDKDVHIIEPAVGTGTFITELIEHIPKHKLKHKYQNEIHCNEISILPYYIANLNIEYTYKQKMGEYEEFNNICLVDTLEHTYFEGKQGNLFHLSVENTERISRQNSNSISVILGNPPYNAKQENFNDNNANRSYKDGIDKRIKDTYIKHGTAQNQNAVYDSYTRFIRWASDRITEGIICFVINSSFIDGKAFDGVRKCIQDEFTYAYLIDLGGNVRAISGKNGIFISEKHTIFGKSAMTGITILFLVKEKIYNKAQISYFNPFHVHDLRETKISYLVNNKFRGFTFNNILPDKQNNWLNQTDNDFDTLLPLIDKNVKAGKSEQAVFQLFSSGIKTQRDEWVYDFSKDNLQDKMQFAIDVYQHTLAKLDYKNKNKIKWDRELTKYLSKQIEKKFDGNKIIKSSYRPFAKKYLYFDKHFNGMTYQWFNICDRNDPENKYIIIPGLSSPKDFFNIASKYVIDLNCLPAGCQCISLYSYDKSGNRIDNITDWGLKQFQNYYKDEAITKLEIFHYTYAILHNPAYREKYELNLKREFPRIPFYDNFRQWVGWGRQLMDLHINYETIEPYPLKRIDIPSVSKKSPKVKLKADRDKGIITLDADTSLHSIPSEAWEYKLGNRSALEWILDQYKEKKPKDKTIAEKFNTYRFADYKEQVIDLLQRVCTVSVETMKIIQQMK